MSPMVRRPPGIELALLGFLQHGPQHGYQVSLLASNPEGLGLVWNLKQSQLYALLSKMEEDGLLSSVLQNQEPHPPRRVYELTPVGRKAYQTWLSTPVAVPRLVRQELLAKLYFLLGEDPPAAALLLENQRAVCQRWLEDFQARAAKSSPGSYGWVTFQYRASHIEGMLRWLDASRETIKANNKPGTN